MQWIVKKFDELSLREFHDIVKLRIDIFVVEQDCPYSDLDGKDAYALHVFGKDDQNEIVAYARIFKPGDYFPSAAIGRVVVSSRHRKKNYGHALMQQAIQTVEQQFNTSKIEISAQTYLIRFYQSHGFEPVGEEYLEDGLPHIHMVRN